MILPWNLLTHGKWPCPRTSYSGKCPCPGTYLSRLMPLPIFISKCIFITLLAVLPKLIRTLKKSDLKRYSHIGKVYQWQFMFFTASVQMFLCIVYKRKSVLGSLFLWGMLGGKIKYRQHSSILWRDNTKCTCFRFIYKIFPSKFL